MIVRTAAEGASAEDVERDLDFLKRLWETIEASANKATAPALIYQEAELPLRVTRDLFTGDFERLVVDHDRTHKRIVGYLKKTSPHMVERVERYKERTPLLEAFGVEQEIRSTLNRRVDLPSGGYLIFDYAEAFTVIDVNTGRFVGSRSKRTAREGSRTRSRRTTSRPSARSCASCGCATSAGSSSSTSSTWRTRRTATQVEDALRQELERDRTKTYVVEISPLGLVEMTRQNVTDGPREVMTRKCPTCDGDGIVVSESTAAVEVERRIRALVTPGSRAKAFKVEVNARVAGLLVGPDASRLRELEELTKRRFFLVGLEDVHLDHMRLLEQGTVEKLAPEAPVEIGQELELKLGEVGLHDARAGVGKIKGLEIVVAEAAKLVGKKVRVQVVAVMDGVAYAVQAGAGGDGQPITAEAEAERPMRAKRTTKAVEVSGDAADEAEAEPVEEAAPPKSPTRRAAAKKPVEAAEGEVAPEAAKPAPRPSRKPAQAAAETDLEATGEAEPDTPPDEAESDAPAAAPRKRTRRGTRGGRKRKPAAAASGANGHGDAQDEPDPVEPELEPESEGEEPPAPVIHLPDRDLGSDDDEPAEGESASAPRKRTRRGTRGGRGRKPKPAAAAAEAGGPDENRGPEDSASENAVPENVAPETGRAPETSVAPENGAPDAKVGEAVAAASPDDWEYTPMSEWGDA